VDDWGLILGKDRDIFSSLPHSDGLWGPPSLFSGGYWM